MFDRIKKGFMLAGYGLGFKSQILFAVMFMVFGFVMEFAKGGRNMLGGFYIVLAATFVLQLVISLNLSTMVQTSPYKRRIGTIIPILTSIPFLLFNYTVMILIRLYYLYLDPEVAASTEQQLQIKGGLVAISVLLFVTSVYMGVCYKFFWKSLVFLVIVVYPISFASMTERFSGSVSAIAGGAIIAGGYLMILVGQAVAYVLSVLFYKKELSRTAFSAALKRNYR